MKKRNYQWAYFFIFFMLVSTVLIIYNSDKLAKTVYPLAYQDLVMEAGQKYAVDPYLILAIMKTESRFKEDVVSSKGAKGLMQIMPETGEWIAGQLGMEDYHSQLLFDPEVNISFAAWYLAYLHQEFNHNLIVVLAAYNAGQGKVKEWLDGNVWDGTIAAIAQVPFDETKNYIIKVTRYYRVYTELYNE